MTLKEELKKLYDDSNAAKKNGVLDNELTDMLRRAAKDGRSSVTLFARDLWDLDLYIGDVAKWAEAQGLGFCINELTFLQPLSVTISWG